VNLDLNPCARFKPSTLPPPKNYTQLDLHNKKIPKKQTTQLRENRKQKTLLSQRSKAQKYLRKQLRQRFIQTSIQGQQRHDADEHGNRTTNRTKPNDVYRVASRNSDKLQTHIPPGHRHESTLSKDKQIADEITKLGADCYCHQEHGINWDLIPAEDQWRDRTRNIMPIHTAYFGYNKTEPKPSQEKVQWGGTGIFAMQRTIPKIIDNDVDPSGLGRWTWIKLQGKQGHHVRIISAYRPCTASKQSAGNTVYEQHKRHFIRSGTPDREPRQAFLEDIAIEIKTWQTEGDHIILCMDANDDVRKGAIYETFVDELHLQEAILTKHHSFSPPATCNKNTNREPIDAIFISPTLQVTGAGYGPFDVDFHSDHRFLWVDVQIRSMFGQPIPQIYHSNAQRFTAKDPRRRKKYNKLAEKYFEEKGIDCVISNNATDIM